MQLQGLPHQRAMGNGPAGSKELIKLETKNLALRFLGIPVQDMQWDLEWWFWVMKVNYSPQAEVSPLALASSSRIRRALSPNEPFAPVPSEYRTPVVRSQPTRMHINAKPTCSDGRCFTPIVSSGGERRSRSRPAAMPCPSVAAGGLA